MTAAAAGPSLRAEVLEGLRRRPKELPPKLFYDARGTRLFDEISELEEYYLTRTELAIMRDHAAEMAAEIGPGAVLIEPGSGEARKVRLLLDHLRGARAPAAYVPVDIAADQLARSAASLVRDYPGLVVTPVAADYTRRVRLPRLPDARSARRVVYYPGSTIGNFHPREARAFLRRLAALCGPGVALLIGIDLAKSPAVLHAAYNDARGVTAEFNRNVLVRLNRELGADFDAGAFEHYAFLNPVASRVEMHLVSRREQRVRVDGEVIAFEGGESIWTESSYKFTPARFAALAAGAGFAGRRVWTDPAAWFAVMLLDVAAPAAPAGNHDGP